MCPRAAFVEPVNKVHTARGHQLVTCPLAKDTLATYSLDSNFQDSLAPKKPLES